MRTLHGLASALCLLALAPASAVELPRESVPVVAPTGERLRAVLHGGEVDSAGALRGASVALLGADGSTLWDDFRRDWNPWLLRAGRFAGREVLLVGVRNAAPMDQVERTRPFVFTVRPRGLGLQKAWLGTSLSRPFLSVDFGNVDGDGEDELVSLEWTGAGQPAVRAYRWEGFGIEGTADSSPLAGADDLRCGDVLGDAREEVVVRVVESERWRLLALGLEDGRLVVVGEARATVGTRPAQWSLQATGDARGVALTRGEVRRVVPFRGSR